jgi:hypothetical protein
LSLWFLLFLSFSENQAINDIITKRKRFDENQDDANTGSGLSRGDTSLITTGASSSALTVKSESDQSNDLPKKKVRGNAINDPPVVLKGGSSLEAVPPVQHRPQQAQAYLAATQEAADLTTAATTSLPLKYRLPLSDVRRTYSSLFVEVINSTDPVHVEEFFRKYCTPNFMMLLKYVGPSTASYFGDHVEIVGLETNIQAFPTILESFPDLIVKTVENKIRVIKKGYCSSITKYLFWGTKLFQLPIDNDYQSLIYGNASSSSSVPSTTPFTVSDASTVLPSSAPSSDQLTSASIPNNKDKPDKHGGSTNNINNNGNCSNNSSLCENVNIVCAKIPKSSVSSSEFTLKKHLKNHCLSKRYDDLSKSTSDHSTINLENTVTSSSFALGDPVSNPQRIIAVGTVNILINPDKQIYKIEFIHSLKP